MHERLLDILAEPGTRAPLRLTNAKSKGGVVTEGALVSEQTGVQYPIVRGIPRFVPETSYASSFGMQWNRFRTTQLDSSSRAAFSEKRFDSEVGWPSSGLEGKWALDAGCGAGRFAEIAARRGPNLVALDLSSAVDATARTLEKYDNVDVVQGSLLEPPFREGVFDLAYCIGVIQHTPDPAKGIEAIVRLVKAGGSFAFTVYARRPWTKLSGKYVLRHVTKRLPAEVLLKSIERAMPVMFPVTDALFKVPGLGGLARFALPVATWPDDKGFTREQRYEEAVLDTFDALSPAYDSPMTWKEVRRAIETAQARQIHFNARRPVNVVGTR